MDEDFLSTLSCPYCGYHLELEEVFQENQFGTNYAIANCECSRYPITEGILVLHRGHNIEGAIEFLAKKQFTEALLTLLVMPLTKSSKLIWLLEKMNIPFCNKLDLICKKKIYRPLFKDPELSFFEIIDQLKWRRFSGDYFKYRFSHLDFIGDRALIHLLMNSERVQKPVLDICCGVGHHAFLISKYVPTKNIVCADRSFVSLYLAKRFFAKNANFICLDANVYLPFENNYFSSIFCLDAFYYITPKRLLANEFKRIMNLDGILLLSTLPNSLETGRKWIWGGEALMPKGYLGLFNGLEVRLLPQEKLVQDYLIRDELNLEKTCSEAEVNSSPFIFLVATRNKRDFKVYKNFSRELFERVCQNLILNPIYERRERGNEIYLTKDLSKNHAVFPNLKYMSEKCEIKKELLKLAEKGSIAKSELDKVYDLWKRFVLIDVPENYVKVSESLQL